MDENLCPVCKRLTRIASTEEYIELDPNDTTKAVKKTLIHRACTNPDCANFAGDISRPTVAVSFPYEKGSETVIETDNRPNVNLNNVAKVASTTTIEETIPVRVKGG